MRGRHSFFGGAKNGMMYGEAWLLRQESGKGFQVHAQAGTHLPSKMRFISGQFEALLPNRSLETERPACKPHANCCIELGTIPADNITQKVEQTVYLRSCRRIYTATSKAILLLLGTKKLPK